MTGAMTGSRQAVIETGPLAPGALEAAATFYERFSGAVAHAIADGAGSVVLVLPAAPYDHADWRRAAARDMARLHAPVRVNVVGGDDPRARVATTEYLAMAEAVTGQYLPLEAGSNESAPGQGEGS